MAGPISHTTLEKKPKTPPHVSADGTIFCAYRYALSRDRGRTGWRWAGRPGGDGVSVLLVDAAHVGHRDALHVLLLDPHVGALDGDRDAAVQGAVARHDLPEETADKSEDRRSLMAGG